MHYELTNHLGNVLATITDRKLPSFGGAGGGSFYLADIVSLQDYYAFGMEMPDRTFDAGAYRYSINGQEKDTDIDASGNHTTALYWEYDSRIGRRWNIDPVVKEWESPYMCFGDNPITGSDVLGNTTNQGGPALDKIELDEPPAMVLSLPEVMIEAKKNSNPPHKIFDLEYHNPLGNKFNLGVGHDDTKEYFPNQVVGENFLGNNYTARYNIWLRALTKAASSIKDNKGNVDVGFYATGVKMITHFESGTGTPLSFGVLSPMADLVSKDAMFLKYANTFETSLAGWYRVANTLDGYSPPRGLLDLNRPGIRGTLFSKAFIGGVKQYESNVTISGNTMTVEYIIWDVFGAGIEDANRFTPILNPFPDSENPVFFVPFPGLSDMYWLQHNSYIYYPELKNKFRPFTWNVHIMRTFKIR